MTRHFFHLAAFVALAGSAQARIIRIVIEHRESPAYKGQSFGSAGKYEWLRGRAYGELDPKDPLNAIVTDIALAPRNAAGLVEYSVTFTLAKPADPSKASGVLLYDVANRGRIALATSSTEAGAMADLFKSGHVLLSNGWEGDVPPRDEMESISVPVAKNADGSPITGPVLARLSNMPQGTTTLALARGLGAGFPAPAPANLDTSKATLTRRASEGSAVVPLKSTDWAFADCGKTAFPGTPDPGKICVKGGFDPAFLYELVYTAKDPLVLGIGYAATRDLNAFFRYADHDATGAANPVAGKTSYAVARGSSQSGNFLRSFIHLGFNQDESGRIIWDGINPNIAVRQLAMNFRFAAVGGGAEMFEPGSDGVLWWGDYKDETRGRPEAGLLDRCRASGTCPKIFETFGSFEFWGLRGSPDLVGTAADRDIPLPPNVRRYYFPGVTHGGGRGGFSAAAPAKPANCELAANPNPSSDTMRALTVALIDWVTKGAAPPPSQYPRLDRGELVLPTQAALGSPLIPGVPLPDGILNPLYDYDFGPHFRYGDLSGAIALLPPPIKRVLPSLVPKEDVDGNETVGVASVLHQAPLGTYLGWNVTAQGYLKGRECGLNGAFVPFAATKAERLANGDPRLSLEERYVTHEGYVAVVKRAAERNVRDRFLLPEDAARLIAQAEASDVLKGR
ncbi:MAG TPA: alpha/beta hydrolase domain-containing protein [Bryobacteraceae bacterium]